MEITFGETYEERNSLPSRIYTFEIKISHREIYQKWIRPSLLCDLYSYSRYKHAIPRCLAKKL